MSRRLAKALPCFMLLAVLAVGPAFAADPNAADTSAMDWSRVPQYRIVPGDRLSIDLGPKPDPSQEYLYEVTVRPDGRITLYPVGDVIAAGLAPAELQHSITALLSADLRAPRATVEVVSMAANMVHVLGCVGRPSSVPVTAFMTVSQAITDAGGFNNDAARNSILLIHREGAHSVSVRRLRLDRFLKGETYIDPPVGRFDIVYVPRSTVGNVSLFMTQLFGGLNSVTSTAFQGWELLNLDRVFQTRVIKE